ncbi:MAG TPA: hypothetical protein VF601_10440 [Beijerinckiaceae bacterium]|jgi:hypothetical protein
MKHRFSRLGFALFAASLGLAAGALAQSFPASFAPRCQPDQLRIGTSGDPCAPQAAMFGLRGPTVIGADPVDVETTGSVAPRRDSNRPRDGHGAAPPR